jgi:cold shock CspA family protein
MEFLQVNETERYFGVLKFFKQERERGGFGFVVRDGGRAGPGDDFVHVRDLERSGVRPEMLKDGQTRLSYRMEQDSRNQKYKCADLRIED